MCCFLLLSPLGQSLQELSIQTGDKTGSGLYSPRKIQSCGSICPTPDRYSDIDRPSTHSQNDEYPQAPRSATGERETGWKPGHRSRRSGHESRCVFLESHVTTCVGQLLETVRVHLCMFINPTALGHTAAPKTGCRFLSATRTIRSDIHTASAVPNKPEQVLPCTI